MNLLASQIEKWSKLPVVLKNYAGKEPECGLPDSFYKNTFDENFVNAMAETALLGSLQNTVKVITGLPEFSQAKKFLDLGGGPGLFAIALAQKNKELMATLFDLPQVTEVAQKFIDQYKMNNQVSVRPGNYLVDDLGQGYDLVLASDTFYPCQKESVYDVVRKIYHSLNLGGIFVSKHWVYTSEEKNDSLTLFNLKLSILGVQPHIFTRNEYIALLEDAGFSSLRVVDLYSSEKPDVLFIVQKN